MTDPLIHLIDQLIFIHGANVPAVRVMSVKDYDELCRRVTCTPVTPLGIVAVRIKELTEPVE